MNFKKQTLPELPYDFSALEPFISGKIMEAHYTKHHNGYVNNFNALLDKAEEAAAKNDLQKLIALQSGLKFNGGGHINHSIFWTNLAPKGKGGDLSKELEKAISSKYGSFENMIKKFTSATVAIQGSGWGWLGYCAEEDSLCITTCANQDPVCTQGLVPLLGIDVWEHAYYLQYKSARPDYLKAIWDVINWANVSERYATAKERCKACCSC